MPPWGKITIFLVLVLLLAGCRGHKAAEFLWPDLGDPYVQTTNEWTRKDSLHSGLDTEIIARATYKSPEWMQAYIKKRAEVYGLTSDEKEQLRQNLEDSLEHETRFFLALAKGHKARGSLKFDDPLWSIFLLHEGRKIYPLEIRESREPLAKLESFYPYVNRWQDHYVLRFPPVNGDSIDLVMSGPLGRVELNW
ncbi:hypothetical protein [Desulfonatronospira sp. MSAO_Bac3]|uniref:hypothetical protein n=1 Tax=Desulfonatronospira sp. MSAO_Bac3 TaxID=2293857 RepID=UPI000FF71B45|nr:hypothetical protein [Desulfonatronospira sp. MSAO_Bac3]RQD74997.1 MAG: hypothetical protein D5S03_09190 [Desulfonatronospira sp. MSAO_Bac3]